MLPKTARRLSGRLAVLDNYEREYSDRSRGYEERPPRDHDDKRSHQPKKSKKKNGE